MQTDIELARSRNLAIMFSEMEGFQGSAAPFRSCSGCMGAFGSVCR